MYEHMHKSSYTDFNRIRRKTRVASVALPGFLLKLQFFQLSRYKSADVQLLESIYITEDSVQKNICRHLFIPFLMIDHRIDHPSVIITDIT